MNGEEILEISQLMSAAERRLGDKIEAVATNVAAMNGRVTAEFQSVSQRVKDLEDENIRENWKNWLDRGMFGTVIVTVNFVLHKFATMVGWKI